MSNPIEDIPIASTSSTTIQSLDDLHTHLPSAAPPAYLSHHIASTLLRKGFQGAEAGALSEIERLLEHHLHAVFSGSTAYAHLAGRAQPNAFDLLKAREEIELSSVRRLRREAKKRRPVIKLEKTYEAESPPRPTTLQDLMSTRPLHAEVDTDTDIKPDINGHGDRHRDKDKDKARVEAAGVKPTYGFEGCPSFPPKWTYATPDINDVVDDTPHGQITKRSLDFVKLTASERGDIPAELGLVNFKKQRKRMIAI